MAKAIRNQSSTQALIERPQADATLCRILGFRPESPLPHESAFSRVSVTLWPELRSPSGPIAAQVDRFVKDSGIAHAALEASAIHARKKAHSSRKSLAVKPRWERGRLRKGEAVLPPEVSGVARILTMTPAWI